MRKRQWKRFIAMTLIFALIPITGLPVRAAAADNYSEFPEDILTDISQFYTRLLEMDDGGTLVLDSSLDGKRLPSLESFEVNNDMTISIKAESEVTLLPPSDKRHFDLVIDSNATLTLVFDNVLLYGEDLAGGIQVKGGGTLALVGADVRNCFADMFFGGGVYADSVDVILTNCDFSNNEATVGGGVYVNDGTVTVTDSMFSKNASISGGGGGVYTVDGDVTVNDSTFIENTSSSGGGVFANSANSTVNISKSEFRGNKAEGVLSWGGGVWCLGSVEVGSGSAFANNSADTGGGIWADGSVTIDGTIYPGNISIDADSTIYTPNLTLKGIGDSAEISGNIIHEYDTNDKILHMENVTITGASGNSGRAIDLSGEKTDVTLAGIIKITGNHGIYSKNDVNIILEEGAQVEVTAGNGIYVFGGALNIELSSSTLIADSSNHYGLTADGVELSMDNGAFLYARGKSYGIGSLNQKDITLIVEGDSQAELVGGSGVNANGSAVILLNGGSIEVTGSSYGIYSLNGSIDLSVESGILDIKGANTATNNAYGLYANSSTPDSGSIDLELKSGGVVNIAAKNDAVANMKGDTTLNVQDGTLLLQGQNGNAVYAGSGEVAFTGTPAFFYAQGASRAATGTPTNTLSGEEYGSLSGNIYAVVGSPAASYNRGILTLFGLAGQSDWHETMLVIDDSKTEYTFSDEGHSADIELSMIEPNTPFAITAWQVVNGYASKKFQIKDKSPYMPSAPQALSATAGNGQVTITWEQPQSDGGADILGYEVSVDKADWEDAGNVLTYDFTGLTNKRSYTFYVRAYSIYPGEQANITAVPTSGSNSGGSSGSSMYTVRFETNGGSSVSSQSISRNSKLAEPSTPTREGYTFTGWYTDEGLTSKYDFDKAVTGSMTLYAGWEPDETIAPPRVSNPAYISGYPDGTFRPDASLTRAEASILLYNLALQDEQARIDSFGTFDDVNENSWYYIAVGSLAGWSVISGYSDTPDSKSSSFKPNETITRAELVAMAMRFSGAASSGGNSFTDVPGDHWATGNIAGAVNAGYVSGYPDGTFKPNTSVTRAEAVSILNRLIGRDGVSEGTAFTDVPRTHWAYEAITAAATDH